MYRLIDFKRDKFNIPGIVKTIEYDPNRTARIALINYYDGEKRYILSPSDLKVGDSIISSDKTEIKIGNTLLLSNIPEGTIVHNIEISPGNGGKLSRSAGTSAQILGKEAELTMIKLSSGETRYIRSDCRATIGKLGNEKHNQIVIGKGATGQGDNYAVIGNADITRLYASQDGAGVLYADATIQSSDKEEKKNGPDNQKKFSSSHSK